ncbi:MAG: MFS transporter [Acidimicrobiales bacterium]
MDAPSQPIGRFDSLKVSTFQRLWFGGMFVFLAMQTQQIARAWLAFDLTGTNTALGGVLIGFGVSGLFAIPAGGVIADRFDKRMVIVLTQLVNVVTTLAIAGAIETETIAYWMIVLASVIGGATISILAPSRIAMTAELVDREQLTNAVMLSNMSAQVTRVIGPGIAGVLIGISFVGVVGVYYLSALLSVGAVFLSLTLPASPPARRRSTGPIEDLAEGIRYTRADPELVRLLVASLLIIMFGFAHQAFLPAIVVDLFDRGSGSLGALTMSSALGAVVTSFVLANTPRDQLSRRQGLASYGLGGALLVFAVAPTFATALVALFFVGCGMAGFQALNGSLVLATADMEYHGRVQSLIMLSFSAFGLAALPFGILADAVGLRETMVGMGVAVLLAALQSDVWRRRNDARSDPTHFEEL